MGVKSLLEEIEIDVADVIQTKFDYVTTTSVPNRSDNQLTFERNIQKTGKLLKTCVLYVDIRNSVDLTQKHSTHTMGRVYTAFSKAVLKAAKHHSGHIRNIIGDRVMIIFPSKDCFKNAVECAITINHFSIYVINEKFADVDFKCGIGIDYGELRVIKVGLRRQGHEGTENRSLVWVGTPANIASRLTDVANKSLTEAYFEVVRNTKNFTTFYPLFQSLSTGLGSMRPPAKKAPYSLPIPETIEMSPEEFANSIYSIRNGELTMLGGDFIRFSKKERTNIFPAILMTEDVFNGLVAADSTRTNLTQNLLIEQKHQIKNVLGKVFGGNVIWEIK